jgi:hypothetical protein
MAFGNYNPYAMGTAIGGGLGLLGQSAFGSSPDYSGIEQQMQGIPSEMRGYADPYIQAGTQSLGGLQQQLASMTDDPGALMNLLGQGYRESPGLQQNVQLATTAANRAAAAGGQLGSPAEQSALAQQVYDLGEQDYGQYLDRALGLYGGGVSGLQGLTGMGAQESQSLSENLARQHMSEANLEQAKMQNQQQQQAGLWGGLGSALGSAAMFL